MTTPTPARISGRFAPGQSGNPTGRTKVHEDAARRAARYIDEQTDGGQEMIDRLIELGIRQPAVSAADRRIAVAACEILLERWAGRPRQEVALELGAAPSTSPTPSALRQLTDAQLEAIAALDEAEAGQDHSG